MSWIGDQIRKALAWIGIDVQDKPLLEAGKGKMPDLGEKRAAFYADIQKTEVSEQMRAIQEAELAEKAAYNCLAEMVARQLFDDRTHLGESMEKGMHRLQVEDHYMGYGHGKQVPVSDSIIRVYREIQRVMHETPDFSSGYGIVKKAELQQLLESKNLNLQDVLSKSGKDISAKILADFQAEGQSMSNFNSDYDELVARAKMKNAIMKAFQEYINEMENYR